ncbi:MAG: permease [Candidatus Erginobacter occultus]|nr:permease [Candidatus Erginobacter occultus]
MIAEYFIQVWGVLLELSPALLLGLLIAGLLHVLLPPGLISRHLSGKSYRDVMRAVLFGIPMPLCSCGVIPTAIGLKNEGASKGAATGFLISTPQTGVDSILVSASFLGWPFALFKVLAAFVTGMIGGVLVNLTGKKEIEGPAAPLTAGKRVRPSAEAVLRYAIFDLLGSIDLWIVFGILLSALISILVPAGYLAEADWTGGIVAMLTMLVIALPLYVCTTGSVPIAAALIAAGLPTGAALVFLMAGPATNIATLGAVYRSLGKRVLAIYLGTVAVMSILFGLAFDWVLGDAGGTVHHHGTSGSLLQVTSALAVCALLIFLLGRRVAGIISPSVERAAEKPGELVIPIRGMTCGHCVKSVKAALESLPGVESAAPDLRAGEVRVRGKSLDRDELVRAIRRAGYETD